MSKKTLVRYNLERNKHMLNIVFHDSPVIQSGFRNFFFDIHGKTFIDFTAQISIMNLGFNNWFVSEFIKKELEVLSGCIANDWQFKNHIEVENKRYEISQVALARAIKKIIPWSGNWKVAFEATGATAVNLAVKICLKNFPYKSRFITFDHAFHGRHGYALDLSSSKPIHKADFPQGLKIVENWSFEYLKDRKNIENIFSGTLGNTINAFVFEPIQGEGGINIPPKEDFKFAVDMAQKNGVIIVADEIQTGLGRTGKYFACEHFDITPDIVILSKSLGGGLPIGAVVVNMDKLKEMPLGAHGGTFHAAPLPTAAAIGTLQYIKDKKLVENSEKMGNYLMDELVNTKKYWPELICDVRGIGLMAGVEFTHASIRDRVIELCKHARPHGLLLAPAGEKVIRFTPALIITEETIDRALSIFYKVLRRT